MYLPKNQYETGFFSNGELSNSSTRLSYTGPYFKTYDSKFYSGKEPNDGPNILLIYAPSSTSPYPEETFQEDPRFYQENLAYSILTRANPSIKPFTPTPYFPLLSQTEINNGQFTRFFVRKANENLYTEVNGNTLNASNNSSMYIGFPLNWVISGEKEFVKTTNAKQIAFTEKNLQIQGLGAFLRFDYTQFYQG
jgi:hypothetical protein